MSKERQRKAFKELGVLLVIFMVVAALPVWPVAVHSYPSRESYGRGYYIYMPYETVELRSLLEVASRGFTWTDHDPEPLLKTGQYDTLVYKEIDHTVYMLHLPIIFMVFAVMMLLAMLKKWTRPGNRERFNRDTLLLYRRI